MKMRANSSAPLADLWASIYLILLALQSARLDDGIATSKWAVANGSCKTCMWLIAQSLAVVMDPIVHFLKIQRKTQNFCAALEVLEFDALNTKAVCRYQLSAKVS